MKQARKALQVNQGHRELLESRVFQVQQAKKAQGDRLVSLDNKVKLVLQVHQASLALEDLLVHRAKLEKRVTKETLELKDQEVKKEIQAMLD